MRFDLKHITQFEGFCKAPTAHPWGSTASTGSRNQKILGDLGGLGCATKWRLPSEMKGVHPEEDRVKQVARSPAWHREEPSRSGTRMLQECKPGAANLRAVARSEPRSSLVTRSREAEPLQARRRQHAVGKVLDGSPPRSLGVAGTARRDRKALNVGDLDRSGRQPQPAVQGRELRLWTGRGVREARSTDESGESRWREGASLSNATPAGKERGLWRH